MPIQLKHLSENIKQYSESGQKLTRLSRCLLAVPLAPFVCFHVTVKIKGGIKGWSIWVNIFLVNRNTKTSEVAEWASSLWCGENPLNWEHGEFFLFSCCVSIHPLQCSWLKTTQHADTHIWERLTSLSPVLLVISPAHRAEKDPGSNVNA